MESINDIIANTYSVFPLIGQNRTEIHQLATEIAKLKPKNILEIGTQYGGTFNVFCKLASNKKISIDLPEGIHGGLPVWMTQQRNQYFLDNFNDVHFLSYDSHLQSTLDFAEGLLHDEKVDVLFIDGDHTYDGVEQDFNMYRRLVRPSGLIVFHDVNYMDFDDTCEVHQFWKDLCDDEEFVNNSKWEINHHCSWVPSRSVMGGIGVFVT